MFFLNDGFDSSIYCSGNKYKQKVGEPFYPQRQATRNGKLVSVVIFDILFNS